ncbi:MAG TPA: DUF4175 family protein [Gemmatimonadaceae bacterium]|jgi:hypothetical protein|nr:DUF4175 family protein [Gemmatimonadaceae bacterium]
MTLRQLVDQERRQILRRELFAGSLLVAAVVAVILTLGAGVLGGARWLSLPRALPFVVWLVVLGAAAALAWRIRRRLRRDATPARVAHAIESEQKLRRGVLLGALELEGKGALAARAASAARHTLPATGVLAPTLRHEGLRRAAIAGGAAIAGLLVLASATPVFGDGLRAVMRPIDAWRGDLLTRPSIDSAPSDLLRGSPVRLVIRAPGRQRVMLSVRQTGEAWRVDTVSVDARTGTARWTLDALRGDLRLVASDGRASSDSVVIHAADRPFLGAVVLRVTYPSYLGRPPETLPVGEPMHLPRGTVLSISGRASVPLASASLAGESGETIAFTTNGHTFDGRLVAEHSAKLRWLASGSTGPVADLPAPLELDVQPDSAPRIEITAPTGDTVLAADDRVGLGLTASDDHGLATVALRIARIVAGTDGAPVGQPVASAVGTSWVGVATVDVSALQLQPGDAVRVRAEAVDQSPWSQRGVSRDLVIKRPTMEESRSGARALGDSAVREARAAAAAQKSLAQRTDEASRSQGRDGGAQGSQGSQSAQQRSAAGARDQKGMNYESAEKARSLAQEQRAMTDRVQRLRQATQQLEQQLKAAGALDSSLARQLGEAQALLRQALTPELMAQMQKLESAAKEMNGEQSRDALRDLAQLQQRLKEQLERSAEMLKRAAHEGAMQTLADEAKELAKKEQELARPQSKSAQQSDTQSDQSKTGDGRDASKSREAANLAERAERLRDAMANLKERLAKDNADAAASKTDQAKEHAANSETGMRRAANAMRKNGDKPDGQQQNGDKQDGDKPNGQPSQSGDKSGESEAQDAAAEMQRAGQAMQDARDSQVSEWKKELTSELDQSVQEMMQLARQERALEQQARSGAQGEDRRSAQSAVEQGVDKANERLQGAGKKSALLSPRSQRAVSDAKSKVAQATQSIAEGRSGGQSQQAGALGEAAEALTKAAASLARDRERANSAKSASGFSEMIQQMQEMAQKQGQINSQAQGLMGMPNGGSGGAGQSMARALARQQRSIADQLDEAGEAAGGDRAAQLAREARQLADALDNGRLDGGTLARQQQLFRRLLDAGRSLEKDEREDSGKREATSAKGNETFTPTGTVDPKAAVKFRPPTWQELRGLSADERRAILDYFTRINNAPAP